jgi:hypothetical protein
VNRLSGSARAKDRLRVFLETLRGSMTTKQGRELLDLSEAQFHHARHKWIQEALELLEPRRLGRPPRPEGATQADSELAQLQERVMQLERELRTAEAREQIARIQGMAVEAEKKGAPETSPAVKPR